MGLDGLLVGVLPRDGDDEAATEAIDAEEQRAARGRHAGRTARDCGLPRVEVLRIGAHHRALQVEGPLDHVVEVVDGLVVPRGLDQLDAERRQQVGDVDVVEGGGHALQEHQQVRRRRGRGVGQGG